MLGQDRLGVELHALHRMLAVAQAHDLLDRAVFVLGPCGDFEAIRQRALVDHQRVVARGLVAVRQAGEHALALVADARRSCRA